MLGAITGDIAGSAYEFHPLPKNSHWQDFPLFTPASTFTDDTVMTLAVANALQKADSGGNLNDLLVETMHSFGNKWPHSGYGGRFSRWLKNRQRDPYNSFGNGSAMRVSPVGWVAASLEEAEKLAAATAMVTHNHPEGIKGAQAVAKCIYLARNGASKNDLANHVQKRHGYDLYRTLAEIQPDYSFSETCQESVPEAIIAFLESDSFEDAIRKAIWLGGDADTQAAIAGSIAEAYYGEVPSELAQQALKVLDNELKAHYLNSIKWLGKTGKSKPNLI